MATQNQAWEKLEPEGGCLSVFVRLARKFGGSFLRCGAFDVAQGNAPVWPDILFWPFTMMSLVSGVPCAPAKVMARLELI